MKGDRKIFLAKCAVIVSMIPVLIYGHSAGPDPRKTGAPGDSTCAESGCHNGTPINSSGVNVNIVFPNGLTYTPGVKQRLQVVITDAAARVYGFQASSRPDSNNKNGQAGTFGPIDSTTQVLCENGSNRPTAGCPASAPLEFIEHTSAGTNNKFTFDWTPPASDVGVIDIYVAGNAANGNGQADRGDHIYTASFKLTAATTSGNGPVVSQGGIADALTFVAGVASNTWTAIFGTNLSATTRDWTGAPDFASGKLPMSLDGVSVTINNKPAAVFFISPGQLNVLAPADTSTGPVSVVVTNAIGTSTAVTVTKTAVLPAFYAPFAENGNLFVTAVAANGDLLGKVGLDPRVKRALQPGETLLLFGTGFGDTNPSAPTDATFDGVRPLKTRPTIRFGSTAATIEFAGLISPGLFQFNVIVPNVPDGDMPLVADIGGVTSSAKVMVSVKK